MGHGTILQFFIETVTAATVVVYLMSKLLMKRVEVRARKKQLTASQNWGMYTCIGMDKSMVKGESQGKWPKHGGSSMYRILEGMRYAGK